MSAPTQTGPAKPSQHGEIGCDISARVTDKWNWVLCRACLNTQLSQTKGKSKALTRYSRPIIISHKSQTSQDQCLWQHDWWVCRCECQEKWSPAPYLPLFLIVSETWGFYGEKPRPLWWALPGDNEGHAAVLSASTDRQAGIGTCRLLRGIIHSCLCVLMSLSEDQDKWAYLFIYTMSAQWLPYLLLPSFIGENVKR